MLVVQTMFEDLSLITSDRVFKDFSVSGVPGDITIKKPP
jgi:hypothetical protein